MTDLEMVEMAAILFGAWVSGFAIGILITTLRKMLDML